MSRLPLPSPAALFALGAGLQVWLWSRAWLYWDQILLLRVGMRLVLDGELAVFAKVMSGGGLIPGCFLQLLVAAPMALWFDYRSPAVVIGLFHLAAGVLLWRLVAKAGGRPLAMVFLAVYWLSPWRLYHSGFLWEPNYMLLPAALHLWAAWRLRRGAGAGAAAASAVLGAVVVLSPQIHASGVALLLLTALLVWRRLLAPRWKALVAGGALGSLPLIPAVIGAFQAPLPAMGGGALTDLGLFRLAPLARPIQYWLRLPSPDLGRRLRQTVFWPEGDGPLSAREWALEALQVANVLSVVLVLTATVWIWRRNRAGGGSEGERFLGRYALLALAALLVAAALAPETLQGWHCLVMLHAACLPMALWIVHIFARARGGGRRDRLLRAAIAAFLLLRLPVAVAVGLGHPMYRVPPGPEARQRVAPENLPDIELEPIPFGSGKESAGPEWRSIPLR